MKKFRLLHPNKFVWTLAIVLFFICMGIGHGVNAVSKMIHTDNISISLENGSCLYKVSQSGNLYKPGDYLYSKVTFQRELCKAEADQLVSLLNR